MNESRLTALLGFAQKARKLASGDAAVDKAVKSGQAKLLIIASDASDNTRKGYRDMADYYNVTYYEVLSKDQIGHSIGKPPRAVLAVTDTGFGKAISEALNS